MAYAALIVEGFDHITAADLEARKWNSQHGNDPVIVAGPLGGSAMRLSAVGGIRQYLDHLNGGTANYDHPLIGIRWKRASFGAAAGLIFCFDSGITATGAGACDLQVNTASVLELRRNGTIIATGTTVLSGDTYYYIEAKILIATSAIGSYEVRINGVTELGPTSSVQTSSSTVNVVRLTASGGATQSFWDDVVVQDWSVANVDFLGDVRVATLFVNAAGNYTQFTPLSSTNVSNVDDATADGDTTYNSESTVGEKDSFGMDNLPTNGTPYIVQATTQARKDDAGSRTLRQFLRVSAADYEGSSVSVSDTYIFKQDVWNANPAGGAWDQTAVNALEAGYKVHA